MLKRGGSTITHIVVEEVVEEIKLSERSVNLALERFIRESQRPYASSQLQGAEYISMSFAVLFK